VALPDNGLFGAIAGKILPQEKQHRMTAAGPTNEHLARAHQF